MTAERSAAGSSSYTFVPPQKLVEETPVGLASVFMFECSGIRRRGSVGTSATGTHSNKHRFKVFTSKRVHKDCLSPTAGFAVNQRIALAATASGKQAGDIHTLFATMDLPLMASFAFKGQPFRRAELESCMEALELEVRLTVTATQTKSFSTKIQPSSVA
jgi:hypothetical protein